MVNKIDYMNNSAKEVKIWNCSGSKSRTWFQLTQADLLYLRAVAGRVQCSPLSLYGGRLSHLCIPKLDKIPQLSSRYF
jgi:hypothetical protein